MGNNNKYLKIDLGWQAAFDDITIFRDVILMDEPLSALDDNTRSKMQNLILDLHKETNNTIIMVTHSKEEANIMCDNIINLSKKGE